MSLPVKPAAVPRTNAWLKDSERDRLRLLETTIERGARMFVEMGKALAEVRDSRLYRESHSDFESYCRERWGIGRKRAHDLIVAAGVSEQVSGIPDTPPVPNAGVAAQLAPLRDDPQALQQTWDETVDKHGSTPTAAQVRAVRDGTPPSEHSRDDTRFELIEDAVALLKLLPDPADIMFPSETGDAEVVGEALEWLSDWIPGMRAAWTRHQADSRQRPRAVA